MKAALIFANPSLTSFNDFLAKETIKSLNKQNFQVTRYNVYDYPLLKENPSEKGFNDQFTKLSIELSKYDTWVIITPMWNFSIPGGLKNFFDGIIQSKRYFQFGKYGIPKGLLNVKKMTVIWTSGSPWYAFLIPGMNHLTPLLKNIARFCGIKKFQHLNLSPIRIKKPADKQIQKWITKINNLKFI
jgi:FMN-dependent NADH-azoreductase